MHRVLRDVFRMKEPWFSALGRDHRLNGEGLAPKACLLWWHQGQVMSFTAFLRELGQLIQERAVISCVYPRLVALDTVNELAGLTSDKCGLITTSAKKVLNHVEAYHYLSQEPEVLPVQRFYLEIQRFQHQFLEPLEQAPRRHSFAPPYLRFAHRKPSLAILS